MNKDTQDNLSNFGIKQPVKDLFGFSGSYQNLDYSVKANEKEYTKSLINERDMFVLIMDELVESIDPKRLKSKGRGRPSFSKDLLKCVLMKVYLKSPARQLNCHLIELFDKGVISHIPSFNTINRFLNRKDLEALLEEIITISSLPLVQQENYFAVDGTGISSFKFKRWVNLRLETTQKKSFVKVNICIASKSKIVTAIKVGEG